MSDLTDPKDASVERLQLRTSMRRWRVMTFVALAIAIIVGLARWGGGLGNDGPGAPHIARFVVDGVIFHNADRLRALETAIARENAAGILIEINSPGGSTTGGEELLNTLLSVPENKPVAAVIHEVGASGGYMTAIGADRVFARHASIVGSIGVIFQHTDAQGLLETIGVRFEKVASGPLKGEPTPDSALKPNVRASLQTLVNDSYDWFVDQVAEQRELDRAKVLNLADGGVLTGNLALQNGLIDELGGTKQAMAWLNEQVGTKDLKAVTYFPFRNQGLFPEITDLIGVAQRSVELGENLIANQNQKGLMSIWPTP